MPPADKHVFYDPAGKRWPVVKRIGIILTLITSMLAMVLCITIMLLPVSTLHDGFRPFMWKRPSHADAERAYLASLTRKQLLQHIDADKGMRKHPHAQPAKTYDTTIGFYVNWNPNSFTSLRQHIDALTYIMPEWLSLSTGADTYHSQFSSETRDPEVVTLAQQHDVAIIPILNNENSEDFQWAPLRQLLTDPARQATLATRLRDYLLANKFAGINIDFEIPYDTMSDVQLREAHTLAYRNLPQFMTLLRNTLAPAHLLVTQDLPADDTNFNYQALGEVNDLVVLMLYDQHTPSGDPGPIAGQDWIEQSAEMLFDKLDSSKVILGLGNYCYDWPVTIDKDGNMHRAGAGRELLMGPALNIANEAEADINMDDGDLNPYFTYVDDEQQKHVLYMLDAATMANQLRALKGYTPRGAALWYLGSEDPTIWSFFDDAKLARSPDLSALQNVDFKTTLDTDISPSGDELMRITALAQPGTRSFTLDHDGLITAEDYQQYPTPFVLSQFGATGKTVALTFDDGPDPRYTPEVLRILRENQVNATFFIVGGQAAQHPDIIRQSWQDGNELGNHTYTHPHIALVSPLRAQLEINATQRVIESLTGHGSMLFRPPFGEAPDTTIAKAEDMRLMGQMMRHGFIIVGMNIDPKDFMDNLSADPAHPVPNTPEKIVASIEAQLTGNNHIILLHDGGGDRTRTVQALPLIIHALKGRGYKFVTVSQLIGPEWHEKLFPPVSARQEQIAGFDKVLFEIGYAFSNLLHDLFLLAIALGVLRILIFGALALKHVRRSRTATRTDGFTPPVTVAIPAYNEGNVVCRTVESVLANDYPDLHVVVVDDGSSDDTFAVLQGRFADNPRVTVVHKENGGKSTALNAAFALATTEIVVCMDADTIFARDTVRRLVQPFADLRVGAVAGNVKVGNRVNLLALWQSLEYITSQNFDRQAFAALGSVAVVPGAVGAWRKAAVDAAGGFESNTLAEDTDLTFKIRLMGYLTLCANTALAYTEVPDTVSTLAKQRFRWAFGILQALWKHRRSLFDSRYGAFSLLVMPSMWVFNIFLQALAPIVDLTILFSIFNGQFLAVLYYTAAFFVLDFIASFVAIRLDEEDPKQVFWLFWQRFFYREFLYYIIIRALLAALQGGIVGWGKLQRKATVSMPE